MIIKVVQCFATGNGKDKDCFPIGAVTLLVVQIARTLYHILCILL